MVDESATSATERSADLAPGVTAREVNTAPHAGSPFLKVFSPEGHVAEFNLDKDAITIGRLEDSDLRLANRGVSRLHATITRRDGRYLLTDARSTFGTSVNGERITEHTLNPGDTIRIGTYVLQFCASDRTPGAGIAAQRARLLLHGQYSTSPPPGGLKYRMLTADASSPFDASKTLKIGQQGLLIPTPSPPGENVHLELVVPITPQESKRFLGEIIGVVERHGTYWMCVELHALSPQELDAFIASAQAGPWTDFHPS